MKRVIFGIIIILLNISLYSQSELLPIIDGGAGNTIPSTEISFTVTASTNSFVFASGSQFQVAGTTGKVLSIDWGDGNVTNLTFIAPNTVQNITKTYANAGTYNVRITGWDEVKQLTMANLAGLTYNVNNNPLPSGLTSLTLNSLGSNFTYNVNNNPLPSGLTYLYLRSLGANFIYNVNANPLPSGLTFLYLGSVGTNLTYNINNDPLPSGLTSLHLGNLGTSSITDGTLNNFVADNATLLNFISSGNAVDISTGLTRAWNNCNITITPQSGYGYTTAQIDNFLINYNAVAGTGSATIDLRGANQPRSSASDAAVSSLTSKGRTVLTNP